MGTRFSLVCCVLSAACVLCCTSADASSVMYSGVAPFSATDVPGGVFGGFDVTASGKIVGLAGTELKLYSPGGVFERTIATVTGYSGWGAFCRLSPDESSVWFGFTVSGNTDDRIYSVPFSGGAATHEATLPGNYDLEFTRLGDEYKPFVAGTNSTTWGDPHSVWLLDTSGADSHVKVAEIGGYSTGIAFDSLGDLYAMSQTALKLYRFGSADVQTAAGGGAHLVPDNAEFSTSTQFAGADITVDGADHVFFNANDPNGSGASVVAVLQPGYAGTLKYDNVAVGCAASGNWSTQIAFGAGTGDVLLGNGAVFVADYWSSGGVTRLAVPEPASVVLLSVGLAALGGALRRRMTWPRAEM